jgi:hypothetical protein
MGIYSEIIEGSYVHSKGQLKKAIKGSKREISKAYKKGDKKEMSFWMQNKKDAESQLGEETLYEGIRRAVRLMNKVYNKGSSPDPSTKAYADFIGMQNRHSAMQARRGGASPEDIKFKKPNNIENKIKAIVKFQKGSAAKRQKARLSDFKRERKQSVKL